MKTEIVYLRAGRMKRGFGTVITRDQHTKLTKVKPERLEWNMIWITDEEIAAGAEKPVIRRNGDDILPPKNARKNIPESWPRPISKEVMKTRSQTLAFEWIDASKWLPMGPHEVLATDGENRFVACLQGSEWWLHELDEPCDSVVTHWMELPELPET